jgi:Holliday junction resolvase
MGRTTPEGKVKRELMGILSDAGVYRVPYLASAYTPTGVPDVLGCMKGRFLGIEVKADKYDKPTAAQLRHLHAIQRAGGLAFVVSAWNLKNFGDLLMEDGPDLEAGIWRLPE